MIRSLWTAATGMQAQELNIDVISNNLANVNTSGFKKSRAEFQDLLYESMRPALCLPEFNWGMARARQRFKSFFPREIFRIPQMNSTGPSKVMVFSR
jgi:flagellar hook-basal body protein